MKNKKEESKEYFERSISLVIAFVTGAVLLDYYTLKMLIDVDPIGSATALPAFLMTIQSLWLIVNPYAIIYDNRIEIKQSLLYNKEFFYLDAKSISYANSKSIHWVYNDGDLERISLVGMRASHKQKFKEQVTEKINASLTTRDF